MSEIHSAQLSWLVGWNWFCASSTLTFISLTTFAVLCMWPLYSMHRVFPSLQFNQHTDHLTEWCIFIISTNVILVCWQMMFVTGFTMSKKIKEPKRKHSLDVVMAIYLVPTNGIKFIEFVYLLQFKHDGTPISSVIVVEQLNILSFACKFNQSPSNGKVPKYQK